MIENVQKKKKKQRNIFNYTQLFDRIFIQMRENKHNFFGIKEHILTCNYTVDNKMENTFYSFYSLTW